MFILALIVINILIYICFCIYCKLTCGICKCSRHLVGKVVIVTGGNAGIGYETAKNMAERGARVIIGCRNEGRGTTARDKIIALTGNSDVHYRHLDLASFSSVRKFAEEILVTEKRLDVLINNAGVFDEGNDRTEDGLLVVMHINHFGHYMLTRLLLPLLKTSAPSRIVNVSSQAYTSGVIDFENLNNEKGTDGKLKRYSNSKLCNVLFTVELERQLKGTGVTANSLHPGAVATEIFNLDKHKWMKLLIPIAMMFVKKSWEGAQTSIYLAVSPEVKDISGRYFMDCSEREISKVGRDAVLARKLWEVSEKIVNPLTGSAKIAASSVKLRGLDQISRSNPLNFTI